MAWVTWRQHRVQAYAAGALLAALAIAALVTELPVRAAYHSDPLSSCLPPATRSGCDLIVAHFRGEFSARLDAFRYLVVLPALAGLLVGAPLVAREYERGTHRLAWSQGVTRGRWLLTKTALLTLGTAVAGLALTGLAMWWRQPFDGVDGRMSPKAFDVEGLVVPTYAVAALAFGVLAGVLLRRTLPAMSLAVGLFFAARLGVEKLLRPHYLAPAHRVVPGIGPLAPARDWVLSNALVDAAGRTVSAAREDEAIVHAQHAGIDPQSYLATLGWHRAVTFQPAGRFWTFQLIEAGIFLLLALAAVLIARRLMQRASA
jgi:hypothetical protein